MTSRQQAQAAAAVFRLPLRDTQWRGLHGQFAGQGAGSSLDFQDHRPYFPGDDPRHINWQAFARSGNYTMKLYRREVSPRVDLLVDVSASMFFDSAKAALARETALFCVESALRLGASPRVYFLTGAEARPVAAEALLAGEWAPEQDAPAAKTPAAARPRGPALARAPLRHGSLRVLVSDLLFPAGRDDLRPLAEGAGRGIVFAPWCAAEAAPDWDGNLLFEDVESLATERRRVTGALLARYKDAYARHFDSWLDAARRHGVRLARLSASAAGLTGALRDGALPARAVEPV